MSVTYVHGIIFFFSKHMDNFKFERGNEMHIQKKSWVITLVLSLMMTMFLSACGGAKEAATPSPSEKPVATPAATTAAETPKASEKPVDKKIKVAMVTDVGGVNDNSFNQSAWEGLQAFDKENTKYLQSTSDADYVPNLTQFAKQGTDLTWGIGFMMADAIKQVADLNPNLKFGLIDGVADSKNVANVLFKEHEGSYLVGVVAGLMTKSNKVGFVGGADIPVIKRFEVGFAAGVKAVKPDATVKVIYTGKFDSPSDGKSTAASLFDGGYDIIFHAAGSTGDGVFNEAKERKKKDPNVWVIGVDKDQSKTFGDEITLTSMMKRVDEAVKTVSKDMADGKFEGKIIELGLKEKGVGLPEKNPNVPADVLAKVKEYEAKIVSGEIKVPNE